MVLNYRAPRLSPNLLNMQLRLLAKWFAIGFAVRLVLATLMFFLILYNSEAAMLNLADLPSMAGIWLQERGPGVGGLGGGHPFYVTFNLFAGAIWGLLFALGALLVTALTLTASCAGASVAAASSIHWSPGARNAGVPTKAATAGGLMASVATMIEIAVLTTIA